MHSEELYDHFNRSAPAPNQGETALRTKRKVIVLCDEWDAPVTHALMNSVLTANQRDEFIQFHRSFLRQVKGNENVWKALYTGLRSFAFSTVASGMNEFAEQTVYYNRLYEWYGFSLDTVNQLFELFDVGEKLRLRAQKWLVCGDD